MNGAATTAPPADVPAMERWARELVPVFAADGVVESVALQGGLGRGHVDELSDIDLLLAFDRPEDVRAAKKGEFAIDGTKASVWHLCFSRTDPRRWSDKQRYIYAYETRILSDRRGRLGALCAAAPLGDDEQRSRALYYVRKLGNRGLTYHGLMDAEWRGLYWRDRPAIRRGDALAAHLRLNQAVELLVGLLYVLSGRPVPSPKWRYHLLRQLDWLPADFFPRLTAFTCAAVATEAAHARRVAVGTDLVTECIDRALELSLLPDDMATPWYAAQSVHVDDTEADES